MNWVAYNNRAYSLTAPEARSLKCHYGHTCSEPSRRDSALPLPVSGGSRHPLLGSWLHKSSLCLSLRGLFLPCLCVSGCLSLIRTPIPGFRAGFHLTDQQVLSCVRLLATPWTVARRAPLSMGFPRQEYWRGLPFPSAGDLPKPGMKPQSLVSATVAPRFFTTSAPWGFFWILNYICKDALSK